MPFVSEAQRRWGYANAKKHTKEGAAARKFVAHDTGGKLPEHSDKSAAEKLYPSHGRK